jgi:hypothetical protein
MIESEVMRQYFFAITVTEVAVMGGSIQIVMDSMLGE